MSNSSALSAVSLICQLGRSNGHTVSIRRARTSPVSGPPTRIKSVQCLVFYDLAVHKRKPCGIERRMMARRCAIKCIVTTDSGNEEAK